MNADIRLLTAEERGILGAWSEMFQSPGWRLLTERAKETYDEAGALYDKVSNDVGFARLQGYRQAQRELILRLEDIIMIEAEQKIKARMEASESDSLEDEV